MEQIEGKKYGLEESYEGYWGLKGTEKAATAGPGELPIVSRLQELEVALELKEEEMRSLVRLSGMLAGFQERMLNSIHKIQCLAGQHSEYEVIEGFTEQVQWPDPS